jgi:uncharacterized Zn finger protein
MDWWRFKPYVSVAERRAKAARLAAKMAKNGKTLSPIRLEGRTIAGTFWGKAWCDNLEAYSDFANRLPRGRSYVRNGSVIDLQIKAGQVTALVSGSQLYKVKIDIEPLVRKHWIQLKAQCAGQIGSLVELLQGKFSRGVMDIVTQRKTGLFPKPDEIAIECSCPDWAELCKHAAAVLYGVGSRLDLTPEMFFLLRKVDHLELLEAAVEAPSARTQKQRGKNVIAKTDLVEVFGIELAPPAESDPAFAEQPFRGTQSSRQVKIKGRVTKSTRPKKDNVTKLAASANTAVMPRQGKKKVATKKSKSASRRTRKSK